MELSVSDIAVERSGNEIVSGISFDLVAGEALIVTGENGSGKSTTLRGIAGLLPLARGNVSLLDDTGKSFEGEMREYCHYLGHQNAMKPTLSVRENLEFWQKFLGHPELSVEQALDEVDLLHTLDLPYGYLSAGQRRRAAIARLLISDRPVWILDEPTAGLDRNSTKTFSALAREFCASGGILVVATHIPLGLKNTHSLEISEKAIQGST